MVNKHKSVSGKVFDTCNILFMVITVIVTLFPLWYVLVGALNEGNDFAAGGVYLWPRKWTGENFVTVFSSKLHPAWNNQNRYSSYVDYWFSRRGINGPFLMSVFFPGGVPAFVQAYYVTILRTILTVPLHIIITFSFAYGFCRPAHVTGKKFYTVFMMIPMFFSGGIVPYYLLISSLNLTNSFWVYILPGIFSFWNVLVIKSFMAGVPKELDEAAKIDGANHFRIFLQIVMPSCKPVIATIAMFCTVGSWNSYYDSMVFNGMDSSLWTLQHVVMNMVRSQTLANQMSSQVGGTAEVTPDSLQFATIIIAVLPILAIYPFVQKYFEKGMLIGSIKG